MIHPDDFNRTFDILAAYDLGCNHMNPLTTTASHQTPITFVLGCESQQII